MNNVEFTLGYISENLEKVDKDKLFQSLTGKVESEKLLQQCVLDAIRAKKKNATIEVTASQIIEITKTLEYLKNSTDLYYWKSQVIGLSFENKVAHLIQQGYMQLIKSKKIVQLSDFGAGVLVGKTVSILRNN